MAYKYALHFDGINNYAYSNANSGIAGAMSWTMELWQKAHVIINNGTLSSIGTIAGGNVTAIQHATNDHLVFMNLWSGSNYSVDIAPTDLDAGWVHIALTSDQTYLKLYINGVLKDTSGKPQASYTASPVRLGGQPAGYAGQYGHVLLNEFRLWNDVRTIEEIVANMYKPLVGNEAGLILNYRINEGTGTVLTDKSASANNGTINGATWVTDAAPMKVPSGGFFLFM